MTTKDKPIKAWAWNTGAIEEGKSVFILTATRFTEPNGSYLPNKKMKQIPGQFISDEKWKKAYYELCCDEDGEDRSKSRDMMAVSEIARVLKGLKA